MAHSPLKSIEPEIVIYQIVPSLILVPPGHPEGYLEAFANLYDFALTLSAKLEGKRTNLIPYCRRWRTWNGFY
jgi:hypothetical protein